MLRKEVLVSFALLTLFVLPGVLADDLDMTFSTELNGISSDLFVETSDSASSGADGYDSLVSSAPSNYSTFGSSISSSFYALDVWPVSSNPRTLQLKYTITPSQSGNLTISWDNPEDDYDITLTDYGADSGYSTSVDSETITSSGSYTVSGFSGTTRYFTLIVDGDGEADSGEEGGDSGGSSSGGGGGSSGNVPGIPLPTNAAIYVLETDDFNTGFERTLNVFDRFVFEVNGVFYTAVLTSYEGSLATVTVQPSARIVSLIPGESQAIDVTGDGITDVEITFSSRDGLQPIIVVKRAEPVREIPESALSEGLQRLSSGNPTLYYLLLAVISLAILAILVVLAWYLNHLLSAKRKSSFSSGYPTINSGSR